MIYMLSKERLVNKKQIRQLKSMKLKESPIANEILNGKKNTKKLESHTKLIKWEEINYA